MDAEQIMVVSGAVVALTQLAKWSGVPDRWGPIAVIVLSIIGVGFWGYSRGVLERAVMWDYFTGWITVAMASAGVFGFTRARAEAIVRTTPPPAGGAGSSPTVKSE